MITRIVVSFGSVSIALCLGELHIKSSQTCIGIWTLAPQFTHFDVQIIIFLKTFLFYQKLSHSLFMVMMVQLFSGKTDEELDSAEVGLRLCCMLGDIFIVLSCNQEEEALLPKLENLVNSVKKLISKNRNSNRFVRKIISRLNLIHNKLRDASVSTVGPTKTLLLLLPSWL